MLNTTKIENDLLYEPSFTIGIKNNSEPTPNSQNREGSKKYDTSFTSFITVIFIKKLTKLKTAIDMITFILEKKAAIKPKII